MFYKCNRYILCSIHFLTIIILSVRNIPHFVFNVSSCTHMLLKHWHYISNVWSICLFPIYFTIQLWCYHDSIQIFKHYIHSCSLKSSQNFLFFTFFKFIYFHALLTFAFHILPLFCYHIISYHWNTFFILLNWNKKEIWIYCYFNNAIQNYFSCLVYTKITYNVLDHMSLLP